MPLQCEPDSFEPLVVTAFDQHDVTRPQPLLQQSRGLCDTAARIVESGFVVAAAPGAGGISLKVVPDDHE
jgi:hypothetical protein